MKIQFWVPGQPLGHFSADEMTKICANVNGPVVAVIDEVGGCAILQPIDPQTGLDWASEADAIAFAQGYITPAVEIESTE